jgi:hypothetical protein
MSEWKHIDTCPKDGSTFRAWIVAGNRVATETELAFELTAVFDKSFPVVAKWKDVDGLHVGYIDYVQEIEYEVEDAVCWQPLYAEITEPPKEFLP